MGLWVWKLQGKGPQRRSFLSFCLGTTVCGVPTSSSRLSPCGPAKPWSCPGEQEPPGL